MACRGRQSRRARNVAHVQLWNRHGGLARSKQCRRCDRVFDQARREGRATWRSGGRQRWWRRELWRAARPVMADAMIKRRVAILISGRGSNMAALIEAAKAKDYPAEIVIVLSNQPDAEGLSRARHRDCHSRRRSQDIRR